MSADPRDKLALAQHATLAEAMAEISRLRTKIVGLEAIVTDNEARVANTHGMAAEIERLRQRVAELELRLDIRRQAFTDVVQIARTGTLAKPTPDEPVTITHGHAPSAPPHDE